MDTATGEEPQPIVDLQNYEEEIVDLQQNDETERFSDDESEWEGWSHVKNESDTHRIICPSTSGYVTVTKQVLRVPIIALLSRVLHYILIKND